MRLKGGKNECDLVVDKTDVKFDEECTMRKVDTTTWSQHSAERKYLSIRFRSPNSARQRQEKHMSPPPLPLVQQYCDARCCFPTTLHRRASLTSTHVHNRAQLFPASLRCRLVLHPPGRGPRQRRRTKRRQGRTGASANRRSLQNRRPDSPGAGHTGGGGRVTSFHAALPPRTAYIFRRRVFSLVNRTKPRTRAVPERRVKSTTTQ